MSMFFHRKPLLIKALNHELRTPLNGIMGILELLRAENFPEPVHDLTETAWRSAELLNLEFGCLMDLCRIESGIFRPEREMIAPAEILADFTDICREECLQRDVALHEISQGPTNHLYPLDRMRHKQVLYSLSCAFLKYSATRALNISLKIDERNMLWEIAGIGRGLPPDLLSDLHNLEEENPMHQHYAALSMHLITAKTIWEHLGGACEFESNPEESRAWLSLAVTHSE